MTSWPTYHEVISLIKTNELSAVGLFLLLSEVRKKERQSIAQSLVFITHQYDYPPIPAHATQSILSLAKSLSKLPTLSEWLEDRSNRQISVRLVDGVHVYECRETAESFYEQAK